MSQFRHELKYVVSQAQIPLLCSRIRPYMMLDPNADERGFYNIRSLYFDDFINSSYYENENGNDPREKFRVRIYNHSAERIALECKRKEKGMTLKTSCPLSDEEAYSLMQCSTAIREEQPALLRKMYLQMKTKLLRPVTIVEYERIPYVCRDGNVRVTFDTNITSSSAVKCFFSSEIPKRPVMPPGWQLMEVKFDEFLPDYIYKALNLGNLQQTAYSKYYLCRRFAQKGE
mgnify:FL=1